MNQLSVTMADKENFVEEGGYNEDAERAMQLTYIEALKLVGLLGKALTAPLEEPAMRDLIERAVAVGGRIDRLTA